MNPTTSELMNEYLRKLQSMQRRLRNIDVSMEIEKSFNDCGQMQLWVFIHANGTCSEPFHIKEGDEELFNMVQYTEIDKALKEARAFKRD